MLSLYLAMLASEEDKVLFESLYHQYKNLLFKMANDILHDEYLAEDAVSEAFFRIANAFEKIRDEPWQRQKGFTVTVLENIAKSMYQKRKKDAETFTDSEDMLENCTVDGETAQALLQTMELLSETDRNLLMMKYIYGYMDREISKLLGIAGDTMRKRLERARRRLMNVWEVNALNVV